MTTFLDSLEWRRAEKSFGEVEDQKTFSQTVDTIENAMIQAPSSFGIQPYHIVRVESKEMKERLAPVSYGQAQVKECNTLFVLCARSDVDKRVVEFVEACQIQSVDTITFYKQCLDHRDVEWSARQAYIALGFGLAACAEMRVPSCPMEGFDSEAVRQVLGLSSNFIPVVYLAVGGKSDRSPPNPRFRFKGRDIVTRK